MIIVMEKNNNIEKLQDCVAVSSLESPQHATRKDPMILSATWFLGKRCNYDCSYCSSYTHDNYSPHIKKEGALHFLNELKNHVNKSGKKLKLTITGGEPFIHPNFLEILKFANQNIDMTQCIVVTNGSMSFEMYEESAEYLTNITFSLHLEKSQKVIDATIEKILRLNKIKKWFLSINLMAVPGKLNQIKNIVEIFLKNNVKFILRKIDPPNQYNRYHYKEKKLNKEIIESEQNNFSKNKIVRKNKWNDNLNFDQYYSEQELDYICSINNSEQWKNIKLHFHKSESIEINTDDLKSKNLNSWKGWQCYIGIDSIYIQHTGEVFRGHCMQGEVIGKIGQQITWLKKPILCPIQWCVCNADMVIRKAKNNNFSNLIND